MHENGIFEMKFLTRRGMNRYCQLDDPGTLAIVRQLPVAGEARDISVRFVIRWDPDMTQAGGPAAINGFLYQILHHLAWLADVRLRGTVDGQEVKDARLILEPRDGGDAQAHASGFYLVEQYKTRATGTWSLRDVTGVLRDLRNSVPDSRPEHARYRFVTNGRPGRLEEFKSFVERLNAVEHRDGLDNETKRKFTSTIYLGDREFLDHLAKVTRSNDTNSTIADERELCLPPASSF